MIGLSSLSTPPSIYLSIFPHSSKPKKQAIIANLVPKKLKFTPPPNAMNLNGYKPIKKIVWPTSQEPQTVLFDVRLSTYNQPLTGPLISDLTFLPNCPNPGRIRVHGVWVSYIDSNGNVVSIRLELARGDPNYNALIAHETNILMQNLSPEEIAHMKMFWFDSPNSPDFIVSQGYKHGSASLHKKVPDYYKISHFLTAPLFDGGSLDIRNVLQNNGVKLGQYFNGRDLNDIIKEEYGKYPYLTFKMEQGHPVLKEISFLYANWKPRQHEPALLLDHPHSFTIPPGTEVAKSVNSESHRKMSGPPQTQQIESMTTSNHMLPPRENAHTKINTSEIQQGKGALPEGFFDNKDADLRARGITPVKLDIKDEYKEFEKLIQEDLQQVDNRLEEEEYDAADTIEVAESVEQRTYRERVEILKRKKMELKAAKSTMHRRDSQLVSKGSSDQDSSSDDDSDDAVDWRAKHL